MRRLIVTAFMASIATGLSMSPALAQLGDSARGECDGVKIADRPDCLGVNPFYTPPLGSVRATDRDMQVLARAMQADQPRREAQTGGRARVAAASAGTGADPSRRCKSGAVRVVYGGYGEPACAQ